MNPEINNNLPNEKDSRIAQLEQALALEASLEKVRARTMVMQKSDELADIASLIFQLLKERKVVGVEDRFHFALHNEETGITQAWITEPNGHKVVKGFDFPVAEFPPLIKKNYRRWENTPKFERTQLLENTIYKGKDLDGYLALLAENPLFAKEKSVQALLQNKPDQMVQNGANFSHGVLVVTSTRQFEEKELLLLLQRFAIVFEQTYIRFLDLQKAEAQARQAQIETALERVRAASMAMHHSNDMAQVASVCYQELLSLGVLQKEDGFHLTLFHEEIQSFEIWITEAGGNTINRSITIPFQSFPPAENTYQKWKAVPTQNRSEHITTTDLSNEAIKVALQMLSEHPVLQKGPFLKQLIAKPPQRWIIYDAFFAHGSFVIDCFTNPISAEYLKVLSRFAKAFEQAYTRFLDLKKAEAQAREAQIETILERVRSRTMAMQKSEELMEVVNSLFVGFEQLNYNPIDCTILTLNEELGNMECWSTVPTPDGFSAYTYSLNAPDEPFMKKIFQSHRAQKPSWIYHLKGKEKKSFDDTFFEAIRIPEMEAALRSIDALYANFVFMPQSAIAVFRDKPMQEEDMALLQRFSKVVNLCYTRFLDLQKAEAQAREAQIEAALERVRARTMAMHKSEELPETARVMFEQFKTLGIAPWTFAFCIFRNGTPIADNWASTQVGPMSPMVLPHKEDPVLKAFYDAWKAKSPLHIEELHGQRLSKHYEYMLNIQAVEQSVKKMNKQGISLPEYVVLNCANFKYGYVMFGTHEQRPAYHDIFIRFTKVFEQTYTRFLDLQKAEAQTREAQIEAALERVRAASMAMHKSSELPDVALVLVNQLAALNIQQLGSSILIVDGTKATYSQYAAHDDLKSKKKLLKVIEDKDLTTSFLGREILRLTKAGETAFNFPLKGDNLEEFIQDLIDNKVHKERGEAMRQANLECVYFYFAIFHELSPIVITTLAPLPETDQVILKRMATTFGMSYRRFLDLQKAEAQAREAQIEAALERLRARVMGMHQSDELGDVIGVLYDQLDFLNLKYVNAYISNINSDSRVGKLLFTGVDGYRHSQFSVIDLKRKDFAPILEAFKKRKEVSFAKMYYPHEVVGTLLDIFIGDIKFPTKAKPTVAHFPNGMFTCSSFYEYGEFGISLGHEADEETINIIVRFTKVFDQCYTRFLDLQKAETQAREAQIEAALERVRAASMAMHKSEDLPEVALATVSQLDILGIQQFGSSINIVDEAGQFFIMYSAHDALDERGKILTTTQPLAIDDTRFSRDMRRLMKKGEKDFSYELKGKNLKEWIQHIKTNVDKKRGENLKKANFKKMYFNVAVFRGLSTLVISSAEPINESDRLVLRRMADTFGRSFTRFIDLKKAEAQAKEAQIEVALERVRARSLAMHKSRELHEVITVVHQQLKQVGLNFTTSNIGLPDDNTDHLDWKVWAALDNAQYPTLMHIPYAGNFSIMKDFSIARKSGSSFFTYQLDKKETQRFWEYFFLHHPIEEKRQKEVLQSPGFTLSAAFFKHTVFVVNRYSSIPFTQEENKIISRFGKVFEQTYTRFLDLQKAEALAREAQIETAMERIRNRAIAMRSSEELKEVIIELRRQIDTLGQLDLEASVIHLYPEGASMFESFAAVRPPGETGEIVIANVLFPVDAMEQIKYMIKMYHSEQVEYTIEFDKKMAEEWQQVMVEHAPMIAARRVGFVKNRRTSDNPEYWNFADFSHGTLLLVTHSPASEDTFEVLRKAAQVFDQAYTRFLDLQRAEAQAREAQIEVALERVRAKAMAMHKSEELADVVDVVFKQLQLLDFGNYNAHIGIINEEKNTIKYWNRGMDEFNFPFEFEVPIKGQSYLETWKKEWKKGIEFSTLLVKKGKKLDDWNEYLFSLPTLKDRLPVALKQNIMALEEVWFSQAFMQHGLLHAHGPIPLSEEKIAILKRFTKVLDLTYTRMLDLQTAEAQAREAHIEAALERVRAQTMAMHKSEELSKVAMAMFTEFQQLNLTNEFTRTVINIIDEENGDCVMWLTTLGGREISTHFKYNYFDNEQWEAEYRAYQKVEKHQRKTHKYTIVHKGEAYDTLIAWGLEMGIGTPEEVKKLNQSGNEKWIEHIVWFAYGSIVIMGALSLSKDSFNILQRFTTVFEQTYTRFLDLQKAEKQTQEIEKVFNENQRLLHSILPKQIAEQIRKGQQTVVKRFEQVSILFADIVGFTILSEKLSPQEVVNILNGLFSKFDDLTDKYGLEKIKTIGDAYMVAAGVPEEKDNHAELMFAFAKEMLQTLQDFNQVIGTDLKIRIGISSGPVVAGVIGKKKFAYDLWGDTVNTAARMEAYGLADCIQVAPPTYEILKEEHTFKKIPNVAIKGKGKMDVYLWKG